MILRWHLQIGNVVIPKSVDAERIRENFEIFDFALSEDDMAALERLDAGERIGPDPGHLQTSPDSVECRGASEIGLRAMALDRRRCASGDLLAAVGSCEARPSRCGDRRRLTRINAVAATAFVVGGSLFCLGALLAQAHVGGPRLAAAVFMVGGVFFTTGGYASVLQVANAPRDDPTGGAGRVALVVD